MTFLGIAKKEGKERRNGGMSERKKERKKEIKKGTRKERNKREERRKRGEMEMDGWMDIFAQICVINTQTKRFVNER